MLKFSTRAGILVMFALLAFYGCGGNDTPTGPDSFSRSSKAIELPTCGEESYLTDLSPMLPAWQDSLEAWLPAAELEQTPEYAGGATAEYLDLLVPVLQQWQGAINTAVGSEILTALVAFDPENTTTQAYLADLSALLAGWESAAETERGSDFLVTLPVFAPDEFAPVISCPQDTTFSCADTTGVVYEFEVVAMDDCDAAPVVVCEPASGSVFRPGTTTVTCTATDASGNVSSCSFDVIVQTDVTAPTIECPEDVTLDCSLPDGLVYEFEVVAMDDCDTAPVVVCEPASGSVFPVGTTTVTCTATDAAGNVNSCSFDVTVEQAEVTIESAVANPSELWPPNHKLVDIEFDLDVLNECELALSCTVLEVTSNEPINGLGDGNTEPDWVIAEDGGLKLRAERSGTGDDRVYTIRVRCEHESGIGDETTVEVVVPHDRGGSSWID